MEIQVWKRACVQALSNWGHMYQGWRRCFASNV